MKVSCLDHENLIIREHNTFMMSMEGEGGEVTKILSMLRMGACEMHVSDGHCIFDIVDILIYLVHKLFVMFETP